MMSTLLRLNKRIKMNRKWSRRFFLSSVLLLLGLHDGLTTGDPDPDDLDALRQEYTDLGLTPPAASEFITSASYTNPGNFTFEELNGGEYNYILMSIEQHLQNMRDALGEPLIINSGYRNPSYNIEIGGATNSQHIWGTAADIDITDFDDDMDVDGDDSQILQDAADDENASEVIPYPGHIHVDWR